MFLASSVGFIGMAGFGIEVSTWYLNAGMARTLPTLPLLPVRWLWPIKPIQEPPAWRSHQPMVTPLPV